MIGPIGLLATEADREILAMLLSGSLEPCPEMELDRLAGVKGGDGACCRDEGAAGACCFDKGAAGCGDCTLCLDGGAEGACFFDEGATGAACFDEGGGAGGRVGEGVRENVDEGATGRGRVGDREGVCPWVGGTGGVGEGVG